MITGKIKTPYAASLYYVADTKEATIDLDEKTVTTHNESGDRSHTFAKVGKFETFQILKYVLPLLLILTSDWYAITIKHELALLALAVSLAAWHKFRNFNRKKILFAAIAVTLFVPIVGTITGTVSILFKIYMSFWVAVAIYEIVIGIVSKEWERMGKVYIDGVPRFVCHYFTFPDPVGENARIEAAAAKKIEKKIYGIAAILAAIAMIGLTYSTISIYKQQKAAAAKIAEVKAYEELIARKNESDRKGQTQVVIKYERVELDVKTQKLHDMLGIKPTYRETTVKTYPWEQGYQRAGIFIVKPNGEIVTQTVVGVKQ